MHALTAISDSFPAFCSL